MFTKLFLLFTIVPCIELWLLFQVSHYFGTLHTIFMVLLTGIIGASMAKAQGMQVLQDLQKGQTPSDTVMEGILILIGGVLLITPGILTDLVGFFLITPITRKQIAPMAKRYFFSRVQMGFTSHTPSDNSAPKNEPVTNPSKQSTQHKRKKSPFNHPSF